MDDAAGRQPSSGGAGKDADQKVSRQPSVEKLVLYSRKHEMTRDITGVPSPSMILGSPNKKASGKDQLKDKKRGPSSVSPKPRGPKMKSATGVESTRSPRETYEVMKEFLVSSPETPKAQQSEQNLNNLKKKTGTAAALILVLLMVSIVAVALTIIILQITVTPPSILSSICNTSDCQEHANFVGQTMNFSVLPCDDFHAYVCSNWKAENVYSGGTEDDTRGQWLNRNIPLLMNKERHHFKATSKITAMLNSCLTRTESDNSYGLETMKNFTKERGIPWPWSVSKGTHPLDVLLEFVINWITPMWFRIRVQNVNSTPKVYLTDAAAALETFTDLLDITLSDGEQASLNAFTKLYNESQPTDLKEIAELFQVAKDVCAALINANKASNKTLAILKMSDIENLTPAISKSTWIELLNKHTAGAFVVNDATEVFLDNRGLLVTIGQLFKNFTNTQLLRQISWLFNVLYADVATQHAYEIVYNTNESELLNRVACHLGVDERYNLLIAAEHTVSNFQAKERNAVNDMLESIIENATLMLSRDATWIDDDGRKEARLKVPKMKIKLWPHDNWDDSFFSTLYRQFSESERTYAHYWLQTARATRSLLGTKLDEALHTLPSNAHDPQLDYDYWDNAVLLSLSAVMPPYFYRGSTPAINYGGLGSTFARQVARAFDERGIMVNSDGQFQQWMSKQSQRQLYERRNCSEPDIEIAFNAYRRALRDDVMQEQGLIIDGKEYTSDQVFFLTYCRVLCGSSKKCKRAVRNMANFARAFKCKRGSAMYPTKTCNFF